MRRHLGTQASPESSAASATAAAAAQQQPPPQGWSLLFGVGPAKTACHHLVSCSGPTLEQADHHTSAVLVAAVDVAAAAGSAAAAAADRDAAGIAEEPEG